MSKFRGYIDELHVVDGNKAYRIQSSNLTMDDTIAGLKVHTDVNRVRGYLGYKRCLTTVYVPAPRFRGTVVIEDSRWYLENDGLLMFENRFPVHVESKGSKEKSPRDEYHREASAASSYLDVIAKPGRLRFSPGHVTLDPYELINWDEEPVAPAQTWLESDLV